MAKTQSEEVPKPAAKTPKIKITIANWFKGILLNKERVPYCIQEEEINKMSLDECKFYLEQSEKQLQDSVDTGQIITERSTNMLNLTSALLIALVAYCISEWEKYQDMDFLLKMSIWGCIVLVVTSILLIAAILPKDYCVPGMTPDKILNSASYKHGKDDSERQKNITLNMIMSYENDIKENRTLNRKRWTLFNFAMLITLIAPICFASYYLLFR